MSTLCLIHGFASDKRAWDRLTPSLRAPWISIDLPGHGEGPPARPDGSFEQAAESALAEIQARVPVDQKLHLAGYSLGARIGLSLLDRAPERFVRATLVGVNPGLETEQARHQRAAQDEEWQALLRDEGIEAFARRWSALPLWRSQARLPQSVLEAQEALRCSQSPDALADAMAQMSLSKMPNYWPRLPALCARLEQGLQLVVGAEDAKFLEIARRAQAVSQKAQLAVVQAAGHNVVLESPQALSALLQAPGSTIG